MTYLVRMLLSHIIRRENEPYSRRFDSTWEKKKKIPLRIKAVWGLLFSRILGKHWQVPFSLVSFASRIKTDR